jgi:ribose transport system permease protein
MADRIALPVESGLLRFIGRRWALLFLLLEVLFFSFMGRGFFALNGLQIILFYGTEIFLLGTAETFVIVTGGIDLSVGYVMGFASVVSAKLVVALTTSGLRPAFSLPLGILATLLIGLVPGLINGTLVARLQVPPFIATFAMIGITHGVSELLLRGAPAKDLPYLANMVGNGYFLYLAPGAAPSLFLRPEVARGVRVVEIVPNIVVVTAALVAAFAFLLKRTRFGHHTYAIGGSMDAALRAGIDVRRHLTAVYMLSSLFASITGVLYMLKYVTGKADAGAAFLLDAIVAVVIGGASMYGGTGTVWGTILGCLILSVLETGLRMMGVPTFDKYIAVGAILILAVLIDQFFPELIQDGGGGRSKEA